MCAQNGMDTALCLIWSMLVTMVEFLEFRRIAYGLVYDVLSTGITNVENNLFHGGLSAPRDACYCPDFERVAYIMALGYESRRRQEDGVISLTPCLAQDVLAALDEEIKLFDGTVLNGDNATKLLQYDLYYKYFGKTYVQNNAVVCDQLFADAEKKTIQTLMENMGMDNWKAWLSKKKQ